MVSALSIAFMFVTGVLSVLVPLVVVGVLAAKHKISLRSVLAGALVFFVMQVLLRLNLLNVLSVLEPVRRFYDSFPVPYYFFVALSAGIFEEFGRYAGYRLLLKGRTGWYTGIGYGLGHGGFESLYLMGLTTVNNLVLSFAINSGTLEQMMPGAGHLAVSQIQNTLVTTQPVYFLFGGLERVFAMTVHLALSLIVLETVRKGKLSGVFTAIGLHTLLNFPPVILNLYAEPIWSEAYVAVFALGSAVYLWRTYRISGKEGWRDAK